MEMFGRRGRLPSNIVEIMEQFGRFEFAPGSPGTLDVSTVYPNIIAPLYQLSRVDGAGFLAELAAAVVPVGGWAAYGEERLVKELFSGDLDDPSYHAMMSVALDFLRSQGVPKLRLNGYESSFWGTHKGKMEPWLVARPLPSPEQAPIRHFGSGEERRIAQIEANPNSNKIYARQEPDGGYVAFVEAPYSDEDPRLSRIDLHRADSPYDLYRRVAESLQAPPYWFDAELEPYFPFPKPSIDWLPSR